jgi:hypothetical protein
MTEPKNIPWKRLAVEAAAIVVSILLAFGIDAWWDTRKDVVEEREILIGLEIEFIDLRARLDQWATFNRDGMVVLEKYLSDSVEEMEPESIEWVFAYAYLINVLDQGGALDALLASGRLERISDRDIRAMLVKWPDWLEDIHTNDLSFRDYGMREIVPFITRNGIPRAVCPEGQFVCPESGPVPPIYLKMAKDPEFRAILTFRRMLMWATARDLEHARSEADKMLVMIRSWIDETS